MDRSQFEINPIQGKWSKIVIVSGLPGNRSDFLVGWLSNHVSNHFVPTEWLIDIVWGKNLVPNTWSWQQGSDTKSIILDIFHEQWCASERWAVTKSHLTSAALAPMIPVDLGEHFVILDLLVSDAESLAQVRWESFVKNFLRPFASGSLSQVERARTNAEKHLGTTPGKTDVELLTALYDNLCWKIRNGNLDVNRDFNSSVQVQSMIKIVALEYQEVMTSRGPSVLSDALGVDLTDHDWHQPLMLSRSRDSYWCLGRWWTRPSC